VGLTEAEVAGVDVATTPAQPEPLTLTTTPNGIEVAYFVEPRRKYEVRRSPNEGFDAVDQDWREVPSVTTILECLDKPALPWWGMTVGVEGVIELMRQGKVSIVDGNPATFDLSGVPYHATKENVVALLNANQLTVNHVKSDAGKRGQSAHDALEAYAAIGAIPDPSKFAEVEQPYVAALADFLKTIDGKFEAEGFEIAVGSVAHGFAGRYDLRGKFTEDVRLVTKALTTKGEPFKRARDIKHTVVPAGTRCLLDLKTSKSVYASHLLQLEAYDGASIEGGYPETDARAVIHVTMHGIYQFKRARATFDNFLAILATYHAVKATEEALK
jgi:hypothetical protein